MNPWADDKSSILQDARAYRMRGTTERGHLDEVQVNATSMAQAWRTSAAGIRNFASPQHFSPPPLLKLCCTRTPSLWLCVLTQCH